MAGSKTIPELPDSPFSSNGHGVVDNGSTTFRKYELYWGALNVDDITYNVDESINTITKGGRTRTFTYLSGQLQNWNDGYVQCVFGYDGNGRINSKTYSYV